MKHGHLSFEMCIRYAVFRILTDTSVVLITVFLKCKKSKHYDELLKRRNLDSNISMSRRPTNTTTSTDNSEAYLVAMRESLTNTKEFDLRTSKDCIVQLWLSHRICRHNQTVNYGPSWSRLSSSQISRRKNIMVYRHNTLAILYNGRLT